MECSKYPVEWNVAVATIVAFQQNEINGVFADSYIGNVIVSIGPQRQNFISRSNGNSA